MSKYNYTGVDVHGVIHKGVIYVTNTYELEHKLQAKGIDLVEYKEVSTSISWIRGRVGLEDKILMYKMMYFTQKAKLPILNSIKLVTQVVENKNFKNVLEDLENKLNQGFKLSEAMESHSNIFDEIDIAVIKSSETVGDFSKAFLYLTKHYSWALSFRKKIKNAIAYPVFVLFFMILVTSVMMIFVVPAVTGFLSQQDISLPGYTTALIATSDFISKNYVEMLVLIIGIITFCSIAPRYSHSITVTLHLIYLKIPYIGSMIKDVEIMRFFYFMFLGTKSSLGILDTVNLACNVAKNKYIRGKMSIIDKKIENGASVANALMLTGVVDKTFYSMIELAEESDTMPETLEAICEICENRAEERIDLLIGMLKPGLTIIIGAVLLWVSVSVFGPIYQKFLGVDM